MERGYKEEECQKTEIEKVNANREAGRREKIAGVLLERKTEMVKD